MEMLCRTLPLTATLLGAFCDGKDFSAALAATDKIFESLNKKYAAALDLGAELKPSWRWAGGEDTAVGPRTSHHTHTRDYNTPASAIPQQVAVFTSCDCGVYPGLLDAGLCRTLQASWSQETEHKTQNLKKFKSKRAELFEDVNYISLR